MGQPVAATSLPLVCILREHIRASFFSLSVSRRRSAAGLRARYCSLRRACGGLVERPQGEQALVGRRRPIVALVHLGAATLLGEQLHRGQEEVHVEAQVGVDRGDQVTLGFGVVAPVAGLAAHDAPVLLLDEAGVVLLVGPAAGEGDPLLAAPAAAGGR